MTEAVDEIASLGRTLALPITSLQLDSENPRLPEGLQGQNQNELAVDMALGFDALTVAESIARNGYFASEPMIAIPSPTNGIYIIVEGNRRLAALLGLSRPDIRGRFADADKWNRLASEAHIALDQRVPVVVVPDRRTVTPIIGFRHITGILQWKPYAQARYIARLVDSDRMDYAQVAQMIGIDRTKVGDLYRDQAIAVQAKRLGIETGNLERSFSLLTVAMSNPKLRAHIGAPLGSQTTPGRDPVQDERAGDLRELLRWVFGDGALKPVIEDSREITKLGNVAGNPIGLKALRDGESLEQALQRVKDADDDPKGRLIKRLRAGRNSLTAALDDLPEFVKAPEVVELIGEARAAVDALQSAVDGG